jgi:predicted PurR-regulated permease PerM
MERFRLLVYGTVLALIVGWVLYIGRDVFIPVFFGAVVVYVIVGLAHALRRLPFVGRALPVQLRYLLSLAFIAFAVFATFYLAIANRDSVLARAPQYQQSLLATIQKVAIVLRIENEPTWTTLRRDLFSHINIHGLLGSVFLSLSSLAVGLVVVLLYATFLMIERRSFDTKIANISSDPRSVARIREVTNDINRRIGSYLALKTLLSALLGAISWVIMLSFGLEFAAFWGVLIAFLNFIPYIGSFLGVLFPIVMSIVQFQDSGSIVMLLLALGAAQFVIGNFLDPYMMGNSLNLSPFAILVSLAAWSELWGIPGAFLAVPITAIVAIILSEFPGTRAVAVLLSQSGHIAGGDRRRA